MASKYEKHHVKPKKPQVYDGLFSEHEPQGMEHHEPLAEEMRDYGRLLDSVQNFRDAAERNDETTFAAVAHGVWIMRRDQVKEIALLMAATLENEVNERQTQTQKG